MANFMIYGGLKQAMMKYCRFFLFFFSTWMWLFGIQLQENLPALVSELE